MLELDCDIVPVGDPAQARESQVRLARVGLDRVVGQLADLAAVSIQWPDIVTNNSLTMAAQWHADDMLNNRNVNDDTGSDGSTAQDRANAAGFRGKVSETVAINPALSISSLELIKQWYYDPDTLAIMRDCANTAMGVWSVNSLDRTVVVALYGQPAPRTR